MCTNSWSFQEREGLCPSHPLLPFLLAGIWEYWWKIEALHWWLLLLLLSHSVMSNSASPWTAARQASLSFTISQSLHKLMPIELMIPSNHLVLCCPLLLLPSVFPSIRVFSNESALCIRWPKYWKYWSLSFRIHTSNKYSGLISFRNDWFDLLSVHRTLKILLQHHSSKASILQCSASSHPPLTSIHDQRKNHSLD